MAFGRVLFCGFSRKKQRESGFTPAGASCIMGENREAAGNFCPAAGQRGEEYVALYKGPELLPVAYYAGGAYLAAKPGDLRGEFRRQRDDRLSGGRRHFRGVCGGPAPDGAANVRGRHRGGHSDFGRPVLGKKGHPEHPQGGVHWSEIRPGSGNCHDAAGGAFSPVDDPGLHPGAGGNPGGGGLCADCGLYLPVFFCVSGDDRLYAKCGNRSDWTVYLLYGPGGKRVPELGADLSAILDFRPWGCGAQRWPR